MDVLGKFNGDILGHPISCGQNYKDNVCMNVLRKCHDNLASDFDICHVEVNMLNQVIYTQR